MKRNKVQRRKTSPWVLATWALAAVTTWIGACNLVVESATDQCTSQADCSKFNNGSVCMQGVCVLPSDTSSSSSSSGNGGNGGGGGSGGNGGGPMCFSGTPAKDEDFFNQCTNATCVEFDNCARLGLCDGAALPALVDPPAP